VRIKDIILSWDFCLSAVCTVVTAFCLPHLIKSTFACSFYSVGINVLSIIFSLFFASLAILMTTSDNDFICYMEEQKLFSMLLSSFKITLYSLFLSLIYSIIANQYFDFFVKTESDKHLQPKYYLLVFEFLFSYSLLATALCVRDSIKFTDYRSKYFSQKNKKSI
jgi:hypothetical protein